MTTVLDIDKNKNTENIPIEQTTTSYINENKNTENILIEQTTTTSYIDENKNTENIPIEQATSSYIDENNNTENIPIEQTNISNRENIITERLKKTDSPIETLCENNKIYSEGKCICDTEKGYYSLNYKISENKCYKKSELPKNSYFNNMTNSYELCYKSCETCLKGGNYNENNCLTCANNYILEPGKSSSNCVENCKYLYIIIYLVNIVVQKMSNVQMMQV